MSEEMNLHANSLCATEDAFDKFQANSIQEENEFITLSDIAPKQSGIPEFNDDLIEIPFDNEVVLDSIGNDNQGQVNNHSDTGLNIFKVPESSLSELESFPTKEISSNQQTLKISSDVLGENNYSVENSSAMIQDSFLSTSLDHNNTCSETPAKESTYPRRTKRGRIPNTSKYPMAITRPEPNTETPSKRRPGRPKKPPPVQSSAEPDSTNLDSSLLPESVSDTSIISENTPQARKRGRRRNVDTIKGQTPATKQRKYQNDNTMADSTKSEDVGQMEVVPVQSSETVNNTTPDTSKRRTKTRKKTNESLPSDTNIGNSNNCRLDDDGDDDGDDMCLSQLKSDLKFGEKAAQETSDPVVVTQVSHLEIRPQLSDPIFDPQPEENGVNNDDIEKNLAKILCEESDQEDHSSTKKNSAMPGMTDYKSIIDNVANDTTPETETNDKKESECLLVEDTSKRRRVAKKTFVYDEGSDEDPFANLESSDDEPKWRKKGTKYYSDDEYVPGSGGKKKGGGKIKSSSSSSEDDIDEDEDDLRKKKKSFGNSPFKKGRKPKIALNEEIATGTSVLKDGVISTIKPKPVDDDIEKCLETTRIKIDESLRPPAEAWAKSNEFQNFIAGNKNSSLQIKKVSSKVSSESIAPLEIPVIDPTNLKKSIEASTQTKKPSTSTASVQTSAPYDIPMKINIDLTPKQSEKACEFLTSVVKTTAELGQLMSQKSEDFMKKKINTENVTDTLKMDYCVRKSFLLFKLAKHNLLQMEEDLANQYEAFLNSNKLSRCREVPKQIVAQPKEDSDSDCEIVEVVGACGSTAQPKVNDKPKPKINPKTVFLNKELSIKIAKKPSAPEKPVPGKKKLEIKGRHAVWINKNVMVKKVTPTQSFLAQDSRNKKPPDTITEKMVSDFFKSYNRKTALITCAPFINIDWTTIKRQYACYYFVNELDAVNTVIATNNNIDTPEGIVNVNETNNNESPKKLFSLCTEVILKCLNHNNKNIEKFTCNVAGARDTKGPVALFRLCLDVIKSKLNYEPDAHDVNIDNGLDEECANSNNIEDLLNVNSTDRLVATNDLTEDDIFAQESQEHENEDSCPDSDNKMVSPLTSICHKEIVKILFCFEKNNSNLIQDNFNLDNISAIDNDVHTSDEERYLTNISDNDPKSLFSLCVTFIQFIQRNIKNKIPLVPLRSQVKPLKKLAFAKIKDIISPTDIAKVVDPDIDTTKFNLIVEASENFMIDSINTLSEEAFYNIQEPVRIRKQSQGSSECSDGYDNNDYVDHSEVDYNACIEETQEAEDNGWATQLQLQEFRSCFDSHVSNTEDTEPTHHTNPEPDQVAVKIKNEPLDEFPEENIVDTSIVKSEPIQPNALTEPDEGLQALNEMTHIPDDIIPKRELLEIIRPEYSSTIRSYNVETFEQFMKSNKMIRSMDESRLNDDSDVFTQSGLRIRRQHEPDLDPGHDPNMSLLVPHNFETLHLVEAKGSLMESSSDDGNGSKKVGKKKEKRRKKTKKDLKTTTKEAVATQESPLVSEKPQNELAILTRRMKDKIRQEEKKVASSDSETDTLCLLPTKKDKNKKGNEQQQSNSDSDTLYMLNNDPNNDEVKKDDAVKGKIKSTKGKQPKTDTNKTKEKQDLVQCNNVDSTEIICSNEINKKQFSGFTAIDQNETANYEKLMRFVYDAIIPDKPENINAYTSAGNKTEELNDTSPVINPEEPVELLECEPTLPIFDDEPKKRPGPKKHKIKKEIQITTESKPTAINFTERHGWHCYSVNPDDTKLYATPQILLEKLPESFVEIYKEYIDVIEKDAEDQAVDRLTNLQTLSRSGKDLKDIKDRKPKPKSKKHKDGLSELNTGTQDQRTSSPTYSDNFDELVPSDDDNAADPADEIPPPMPVRSTENNLAKNLLMDDHDSDSDSGKKIKQEPKDQDTEIPVSEAPKKKAGPKSKTKVPQDPDSLVLTADKMMNKELNLLYAPIVLQDGVIRKEVKDISPKEETKQKKKISKSKDAVKNEDDSSSEEEKQWVSTKERLLKRMGKKEDVVADDAKRVKLVNEFIERRDKVERKDKRTCNQSRNRRNKSKRLERQKQLRFLSNELYNQGADGVVAGKRGPAASLFTGRRNIRKVIDKKSLARSTVMANMAEFERKRRLTMRQNKLREVLGCEEGVNVLVINDEVCLEYDFQEQRPVVTVHPFFTRVMKAHQYEGVKFMWDACFESLEQIARGEGGGGCILAHCMGLGKTLQVLALLHTVLTHPAANMHRVLVCCPLSTVLNWVDEIHKWIGPVTHEIKVFELSKLRKTYERAYQLEDWYSGGGIFIIGYELFRSLTTLDPEIDEIRPTIINKIRTALLDPGPDIIVCDEGHLLKNDCSVLAVAMSRVVTKRRIILTGTPMQNNLREYFCMVNFIKPNLLGTYSEYSNRFENPIMNGQHRDSREEDIKLMKARTHILHKVLEGCLQRQEASVLYPYLPKKHEYTVFIPLTKCQWDLYNHYIDFYTRTQKQKQILKDFHILQKIWSHPQVLHNFQMKDRAKKDAIKAEKLEDDLALADIEADMKPAQTEVWWLQYLREGAMLDSLDSSNKFVAVFRILHECVSLGDKVLIFSTSLFCLDALEYFLKKINSWSLGQEYYRLDGSVPAEVRQKWCREFNAENNVNTKLFLISTRAGCLGLNMTAANRVIILDTSWNPAHDIQSIFRVYRFGQKKDCYIYRLVALGTMEQKIYERSVTKQAVACRVVDEQQIDRHYNLAELTELYSVDETGMSVAGGVAVGVGDVALLRVARDAAVHAVHEHDSLLRGEHEQGLPEHERAAAWSQFQLEHEHKQKQNDLHVKKAAKVAMKRLEMEHLRKQKEEEELKRQQEALTQTILPIKIEPNVGELLHPKEEPGDRQRGKRRKRVVQCRIPIASAPVTPQFEPQPGPSKEHDEQEKVNKITQLLIKHNFVQSRSRSSKISKLVSKVKCMIATGQPMTLGPGYDELSASIAGVLLNREPVPTSMPPLTNVQPPPPPSPPPPPPVEKKRGRKKKTVELPPPPELDPEPIPAPPEPEPEETTGRKKRKAAIAAEKHFDDLQDVINLDDDGDDWQADEDTVTVDDWLAETEANSEPIPEEPTEPVREKPKKDKTKIKMEKSKPVDSSIVLSDDEVAITANETSEPDDVIQLHPSLLTNANFIQIVAHTYRTGNPMLDEDAATLAAQYSTLKTLRESESEGKPITSGPVYDIAMEVLGKSVLKKLQMANPQSSNETTAASKKLQSLLGQSGPSPAPPAPAVKKPKIGPKSKVNKVKEEPIASPTKPVEVAAPMPKIKPVSNTALFSVATSSKPQTSTSAPREESILPDDDVIISEPPLPSRAPDMKPIMLRKVKLAQTPPNVTPISLGRGPALAPAPPAAAPAPAPPPDGTICLDSDEDDPAPPPATPAPAPPQRRRIVQPILVPQSAPVPVALTGPNSRAVPLAAPTMKQTFYQLSPCGTHVIPVEGLVPVPNPFTSRAVPVGGAPATPKANAVRPGLPGPSHRAPVPVSITGPNSQPLPISLIDPDSPPGPVPMSLIDASGRTVGLAGTPYNPRLPSQPIPLPATNNILPPQARSGNLLRISKSGLVQIIERKRMKLQTPDDLPTTIIDDDEPVSVAVPALPVAKTQPPKPPPKIPSPAPTLPNAEKIGKRKSRRISSSSSSSSARSRSPSPNDPLAILKDVVHIQAPERQPKEKPPPSKVATYKPKQPVKSDVPKPTEQKSIDLTNIAPKPGPSKTYSKVDVNKHKMTVNKNKSNTAFDSLIGKKPATSGAKPTATPNKLIGTSKSIILDVKSKSLKVDTKPSTQLLKKLVDKRPAPSTSAAGNQKKPKLMTLQDFDIEDIDGIIELD